MKQLIDSTSNGFFDFGFPILNENIKLEKSELIIIGSRPAVGKLQFVLNILEYGQNNGCFISLNKTKKEVEKIQNNIRKNDKLIKQLENVGIQTAQNNYIVKYFELPTLVELCELIVQVKDEFDYFIIDQMVWIDEDTNPLFSKEKNYQNILRHLKVLANVLNKNIILVSSIHHIVEYKNSFNFTYHGIREKHVDYLFVLHRPSYYGLTSFWMYDNVASDDVFFCIAKSKDTHDETHFRLTYNFHTNTFM